MADAYVVDVTPRANADLQSISADVALRISKKMRELAQDPRPRGDTIKRLQGLATPTLRLRIGDYRAVFRVQNDVVRVLRIVHRSQLDRTLEDLF
ncbi:MAG: type II toxin-antitoxin system RelE/ParE family toxin [Planctomycetes bacterium]|nr:type II toxin-antitoxin system RelE/ParE family toxin [Planctomycetota bacterium]